MRGERPALAIAQVKYAGALDECGGSRNKEKKIISHLRILESNVDSGDREVDDDTKISGLSRYYL